MDAAGPTKFESKPRGLEDGKQVWGWAIYDFANTIFSMNILTLYFACWLIIDNGIEDIWYSLIFSFSMFLSAISMPILGVVSDAIGRKKSFLILFTLGCVLATFLLGIVAKLDLAFGWKMFLALAVFAVANYCFQGGLVFYNALLPSVSAPNRIGQVSGLGVSLGYFGAIAGMFLVLPFVQGKVPFFSLPGKQQAFIPTAIFLLLFSLPTFLWVKRDLPLRNVSPRIIEALKSLWQDLKDTKRYPGVLRFLISDFMFEDAIATAILFMAVYTQAVMGFDEQDKTFLFAVSTTFAALGSLGCGWFTDKVGPKRTLSLVVWGWILCLVAVSLTSTRWLFWILASLVGIFLGSTWTASRPLLAGLVPKEKMGQFFGLYSLSGRAAAIIGPLIWGLVVLSFKQDSALVDGFGSLAGKLGIGFSEQTLQTIEYRFAVLALALLMLVGWIFYRKVPDRFRHPEQRSLSS
jgi:UMF1 family MFS transporter